MWYSSRRSGQKFTKDKIEMKMRERRLVFDWKRGWVGAVVLAYELKQERD